MCQPQSLTGSADAMSTAGWRPTHQSITAHTLPALPTPTASVHTVTVSTAVGRLATPRMDTQDGGDTPVTAPAPVVTTGRV